MKPWFVFGGDHYYPSGGTGDFLGAFATEQEAKDFLKESNTLIDYAYSKRQRYEWTEIENVLDMMKDDYGN